MVLVTVADDRYGHKGGKYIETQNKIKTIFENNPDFGINQFRMWTYNDLVKSDFYEKHKDALDEPAPHINGRLYKPLVIYEALKELNDGDFLLYNDTSPEMWQTLSHDYKIDPIYKLDILKNLCIQNNGILTAHAKWNWNTHVEKGQTGYHTHENFTSELCINTMGMQDYKYSLQHASGMIVLQKSKKTMDFLEEWIYWLDKFECRAQYPRGGYKNDYDNYWVNVEIEQYGKIGHRHDQSVSGLLINKMNNKIIETLDWYERAKDFSAYNFLNFCKTDYQYNFFETNLGPGKLRHKLNSKVLPVATTPPTEWYITVEDRKI